MSLFSGCYVAAERKFKFEHYLVKYGLLKGEKGQISEGADISKCIPTILIVTISFVTAFLRLICKAMISSCRGGLEG